MFSREISIIGIPVPLNRCANTCDVQMGCCQYFGQYKANKLPIYLFFLVHSAAK